MLSSKIATLGWAYRYHKQNSGIGLQVPQTKWWHWDGPTCAKGKIVALKWAYRCHKQNGGIGISLQIPKVK